MPSFGASLAAILRGIKQRLINEAVLEGNQVFVSLRMMPPSLETPKRIIVLPLMHTFENKGGMGIKRVVEGRIDVYYQLFQANDANYVDDSWLVGENQGETFFVVMDRIIDKLDQLMLTDDNGVPLLVQPMTCEYTNEPHKDYKDYANGEGCVELSVAYEYIHSCRPEGMLT